MAKRKLFGAALKAHLKKIGRRGQKRTYMAKTKSHGKKRSFTLPLAVVAGFGVPAAKLAYDYKQYKDINVTTRQLGQFFTGYDWTTGKWNIDSLRFGALPVVAGFVVHMIAGKLGINRALGAAGIPIIRI